MWLTSIRSTLETNGMLSFYATSYHEKPCFIYKRFFQRLSDQFHQNAFSTINDENSKLRTYAIYKTKIGLEKYLTLIKNPNTRKQISKLRLSNHKLMIETGRYHKPKTPKDLRFCPFCPNVVETEAHLLFYCPTYTIMRKECFKTLLENNPGFRFYTTNLKMEYIMTHIDKHIGKYIYNSFELREFLLTHPKRNS